MNGKLDNQVNQMVTERKIYKGKALWVGALFGGTLAAGYIIAENFKAFNKPDKARKTWLFAVLATIVFIAGTFIIPEYVHKFPNIILPFIYTGIAALVLNRYQGELIRAHIKAGGQVYKWGRIVIIGLIGLVVTFIAVAGVIFIKVVIDPDDTNIRTNTYGVFHHEISYDDNNITTNEVDTLALAFTVTGFFSMNETKYVFVEKIDNNYEISISCLQSIAHDTDSLEGFIRLRDSVQSFYPNNKIIFNLIFDSWDNVLKRLE